VKLTAPAKVNLYLEIVGPRSDGYTNVVLVLQSVALADVIHLEPAAGIAIHCDHPLVPLDRTNLAYRAAELMQTQAGTPEGVRITIEKKIPVADGLAGGSGNGAAVLVGLNQLWGLGLSVEQLCQLGARLGSDVPFCIRGGTALGYGRGEVLAPVASPGQRWLVLAKLRHLEVSTAWAYKTFRTLPNCSAGNRLSAFLCNLIAPQPVPLGNLLYNDLERAVLPAHPAVEQLKKHLQDQGALGVLMSGSGPTVFALAADAAHAQELAQSLDTDLLEVFVTHTVDYGIGIG